MKKTTWLVGAVVAATALFCAQAEAGPITFYSGDGGDSVDGHTAVAITPHSVWGDVSASAGLTAGTAQWISYANTGLGGAVAPDVAGRNIGQETALFTRLFDLLSVSNFAMWILADDTATVRLLGPGGFNNTLYTAYPGQVDPCAPGGNGLGIGCLQADMGFAALSNLAAGHYTLEVYTFQTNQDVFGVQYAGSFQRVPEPGTLLLLGFGMVGLFARRKRSPALSVS